MHKLSAVIPTKNEESRIKRCLDSLKGLADEIIIIDDESTDKTVDIAKGEYGAKVIINKGSGNFDKQRNLGINAASGDWILQLDSDVIIPAETAQRIKEVLANNEEYNAFTLIKNDCVFERPLNYVGRLPVIMLFKKGKGRFIGEKAHETLKIDGEVGNIDARVLHYNQSSIKSEVNKYNFYTDVESDIFFRDNKDIDFKFLKGKLIYKSFKLFFKHYVKHKGYKDGSFGLIWSILNVLNPLFLWLKVLEKSIKRQKVGS